MKKNQIIAVLLLIILSCSKNKPKVGEYEARFYCNDPEMYQYVGEYRYQNLTIVEVNENEIKIAPCATCDANTILQKDKKLVSGIILMPGEGGTGGPSYPSQEINITGTWEKHKGKYSITGFHQWIYTEVDVQNQTINKHIVNGKFEIKTK